MGWIKSVLHEPEDRVRIQASDPEPNKSIYTISKIEVVETEINPQLRIGPLELNLNPNLVAIIGGRGSGKTALLDLIASCFIQGNKLDDMKQSFYGRLYGTDARKKRENNNFIDVSLKFNSGETFSKKIGNDSDYFGKADVIYLTQNHFDEYFSEIHLA